jgi:HK97 family phage portal protein
MVGLPSDGGLFTGVTPTTVLGLSAVARCLQILTNGVSQCEWYERRGTLDLPTSRLVTRPHPDMTRRDWVNFVVASLALWDRSYLLPTGGNDSEGVPMNLLPLDVSQVTPAVTTGLQWISPVPSPEFWVGQMRVPRSELVILNRGPIPGISETAMGIIRLARIKFAEALAADGYSSRYWQSGGPTDRALESDGIVPDAIAKQNSERWAERRAKGPDYVPMLVGGTHLKQYGVDPTAQSAVEARRELVADIARFMGVSTSLVNAPAGDSETYTSTEVQGIHLNTFTLQDYFGAIEDAITDLLPGGRRLFIDPAPLYRSTLVAQAQAYQLLTGGKAVMSVDEVRERMNLPPVENPDELNPPAPAPVIAAPGGQSNGGNQGG